MKMDEHKQTSSRREDVCPSKKGKLDLDSVRLEIEKATKTGPEYWRSLEELAGSADFQEALHREFPKGASEWVDSVSRRGFLKVMGASMALAGMTGCVRLPLEPLVPYVRQPEDVVPGRPAAQLPEDLPAGQVACVRAGQSRQRARRREDGLRPADRDAV